jgi:hypothetical protein
LLGFSGVAMSVLASDETSPERLKSKQMKNGKGVVLIPQPSDDPEDPLVSKSFEERFNFSGNDS